MRCCSIATIHLLSVISFISASKAEKTLWTQTYGNPVDLPFSGIITFAHLPHVPCLSISEPLDIAIIGYPFDTAVSYRPGARFGPHGIRDGSRRLRPINGWSMHWRNNPYDGSTTIYDCGDVNKLNNNHDSTLNLL
jgi:agmatinase